MASNRKRTPPPTKPTTAAHRRALPAVSAVLETDAARAGIAEHGRRVMTEKVRAVLADLRDAASGSQTGQAADAVAEAALERANAQARLNQRPVFNLTGTVLHTNLGRAVLAEAAREAALDAMRSASNLEFDLETGQRGERDDHVSELIKELTGAEDAIVVNNNAAALILILNTLARGKQTIVSRGELVEIGGSFRLPDIMARAGTRLFEVGTTNRTHARDYQDAIGVKTALLMKVHTRNYRVEGFTAEVSHRDVARIAQAAGLPFVDDLGSGALVALEDFGLPAERTVRTAVGDGADLVTFSGDKLLGGPQAGLIAGRSDLVRKLAKNPLKRALRLDRIRLAALEATLRLYRDPARLAARLPTLRFLARPRAEIHALAGQLLKTVNAALEPRFAVSVIACDSETGSGALPLATLPSAGLAIAPRQAKGAGRQLQALAAALRKLPRPVIGRIAEGQLILDLRCLEDVEAFAAQIGLVNPVQSA